MEEMGLIRIMDRCGRVCIPSELRKAVDMHWGDPITVNVSVLDKTVFMRKYPPKCIFTGATEDLIEYKGIKVSRQAALEISELEKSTRSRKRKKANSDDQN